MGFIKDLDFRRIILKCDNEPSTKSLQDAVLPAWAGLEVNQQGPPWGGHMAYGRVELVACRHCINYISGNCACASLHNWYKLLLCLIVCFSCVYQVLGCPFLVQSCFLRVLKLCIIIVVTDNVFCTKTRFPKFFKTTTTTTTHSEKSNIRQ